jgi:hypothetical protein
MVLLSRNIRRLQRTRHERGFFAKLRGRAAEAQRYATHRDLLANE